jgi:hypothetical protein
MTETISSKMPTELIERIEEAQEEGESRSATVRRLVRDGIEAQGSPDGYTITRPTAISLIGWFVIFPAFGNVDQSIGYLGIALVIGGLIYAVIADRSD